jgi:hypothetical protein
MAKTTKSDVLIPEVFDEVIEGAFANKNAFMGSMLATIGAAVIAGDMPGGDGQVGDIISVPYFGTIGEFDDVSDGDPAVPKKVRQGKEQATVGRSTLAFEVSRWARASVGKDIYEEGARQVMLAAQRKMDAKIIAAAVASGGLVKDVFSATTPRKLDYDLLVEGRQLWGDEQDDIVGMVVRSKTYGDLLKLKDSMGRPLLTQRQNDEPFDRFMGIPVGVSDALPVTVTMSAVTEAGTTPPDITLSGTPVGEFDIRIEVVTAGARGTATVKFSTDGGVNFSDPITTAATFALTDTAIDSLVGINGATGLTATYENASASANNVWTATATGKRTSLVLKSEALAFWYNRSRLQLQTDKDILSDTDIAALHLYSVAHRYRRRRGSSKSGVVRILHN